MSRFSWFKTDAKISSLWWILRLNLTRPASISSASWICFPYRRHVGSGTWIEYHSLTIVDWMTAVPSNSMLAGSVKIASIDQHDVVRTGQDNEADENAPVRPINLFLHSLFSRVTTSTSTYPYRAMIKTLSSYKDVKSHRWLSAILYILANSNLYLSMQFSESEWTCITLPYFAQIGHAVADIWPFVDFSRWRRLVKLLRRYDCFFFDF